MIRYLGPLGPAAVRFAVARRFAHVPWLRPRVEALGNYVYHSNAGPASGDRTLSRILHFPAWAQLPLAPRLEALECPVLFLYGENDWMDAEAGAGVCERLGERGRRAGHGIIPDAGHQLFLENPTAFDSAVLRFCAGGPASN